MAGGKASRRSWYCPRCGRDGLSPAYPQRAHARHCEPPRTIALRHPSPAWRYYWRLQLWGADTDRCSSSEAMLVRVRFAEALYRAEVAGIVPT